MIARWVLISTGIVSPEYPDPMYVMKCGDFVALVSFAHRFASEADAKAFIAAAPWLVGRVEPLYLDGATINPVELISLARAAGWPRVTLDRLTSGGVRDINGPGVQAWHLFAEQMPFSFLEDAADKLRKIIDTKGVVAQ